MDGGDHSRRAWAHYALGKVERALDDAALAVESTGRAKWPWQGPGCWQLPAGSIRQWRTWITRLWLDPHHPEALFLRASVYRDRPCPPEQAKADCEASLADFTAVLHLNPRHADSYASRASTRIGLQDFAAALADCEKAIQLDSKCVLAYRVRGKIHQQQGNLARLSMIFRPASAWLRATPSLMSAGPRLTPSRTTWSRRWPIAIVPSKSTPSAPGLCPAWTGPPQLDQHDQALADCSQAIGLGLEVPNLYLCRANLHFLKNRLAEAMLDCNQALRVAPGTWRR